MTTVLENIIPVGSTTQVNIIGVDEIDIRLHSSSMVRLFITTYAVGMSINRKMAHRIFLGIDFICHNGTATSTVHAWNARDRLQNLRNSILVHSLPLSLCLFATFSHFRLRALFCAVKFVCRGEKFEQGMHKTHMVVTS